MSRVAESLLSAYEHFPNRKLLTRRECDFLRDNGLLEGRYELINGEIISKMSQKPPHAYALQAVIAWLTSLFSISHLRCQLPILVAQHENDTNEPEPDVAVTLLPFEEYPQHHPGPDELLLVAEVSDSTLRFDRVAKAALYARAGIVEYWIVDIAGRQLFVHRQPAADGYGEVVAYGVDEAVATLARPSDAVRVADLLPPQ